jgi:hypothetical protein
MRGGEAARRETSPASFVTPSRGQSRFSDSLWIVNTSDTSGTHTARTTPGEDLITIAVSLWMVVGLLVDAYKHSTDPQLETFWTPWHAIFYSGFLATAAWLLLITVRRQVPGRRFLDWAPPGHRLALLGIALFAAGGIGDAVWHSVLGVETSLDALLSPSHLLLFVGMLLIVSAPFQAAWLDTGVGRPSSFRAFVAPLVSLTFSTALVAFFFEYAWLPAIDWLPRQVYLPDSGIGEEGAVLGVLGIIVTTVILMGPTLAMLKRWHTPFGSITILFVVVNLFIAVAFDKDLSGLVPGLVAGLAGDALVALRAPRRLTAFLVPVVLWGVYFVVVGRIEQGLGWPPEIWGGGILFAGLAGLGLQLLIDAGGVHVDADARRPEYLSG